MLLYELQKWGADVISWMELPYFAWYILHEPFILIEFQIILKYSNKKIGSLLYYLYL